MTKPPRVSFVNKIRPFKIRSLGIRQRVSTHEDPRRFGKPLTGNKAALSRYRVVDHRVISRVEANDLPMLVVALGHRKLGF